MEEKEERTQLLLMSENNKKRGRNIYTLNNNDQVNMDEDVQDNRHKENLIDNQIAGMSKSKLD